MGSCVILALGTELNAKQVETIKLVNNCFNVAIKRWLNRYKLKSMRLNDHLGDKP